MYVTGPYRESQAHTLHPIPPPNAHTRIKNQTGNPAPPRRLRAPSHRPLNSRCHGCCCALLHNHRRRRRKGEGQHIGNGGGGTLPTRAECLVWRDRGDGGGVGVECEWGGGGGEAAAGAGVKLNVICCGVERSGSASGRTLARN